MICIRFSNHLKFFVIEIIFDILPRFMIVASMGWSLFTPDVLNPSKMKTQNAQKLHQQLGEAVVGIFVCKITRSKRMLTETVYVHNRKIVLLFLFFSLLVVKLKFMVPFSSFLQIKYSNIDLFQSNCRQQKVAQLTNIYDDCLKFISSQLIYIMLVTSFSYLLDLLAIFLYLLSFAFLDSTIFYFYLSEVRLKRTCAAELILPTFSK